jgi:hypothetical protein
MSDSASQSLDYDFIVRVLQSLDVPDEELAIVIRELANRRLLKIQLLAASSDSCIKAIASKVCSSLGQSDLEETFRSVLTALRAECESTTELATVKERKKLEFEVAQAAKASNLVDVGKLVADSADKKYWYLSKPVPVIVPSARALSEISIKKQLSMPIELFLESSASASVSMIEGEDEDGNTRRIRVNAGKAGSVSSNLKSGTWIAGLMRCKYGLLLSGRTEAAGAVDVYLIHVAQVSDVWGWARALEVDREFRSRLPFLVACSPEKSLEDFLTCPVTFKQVEDAVQRTHSREFGPKAKTLDRPSTFDNSSKKVRHDKPQPETRSASDCFEWLNTGKCTKAVCNYAHKPEKRNSKNKNIQLLKTVKEEPKLVEPSGQS